MTVDVGGYSIRVASRLTGLSADTLRMWERRYGFPKPQRNQSQARLYTDSDIEQLVLVSRALKAGFRAGEVIHRGPKELRTLLENSARAETSGPTEVHRSTAAQTLIQLLRADDLNGLRTEMRRCIAMLGPKRFLVEVASPLLQEVGAAWASGRIGVRHEHVLSEVLSTQLRLLLSVYEDTTTGPVALLTTLSQEEHGLGLEMIALYMALEGVTPRMLGVDTPADQIAEAAQALKARVVGLSVTESSDIKTTESSVQWLLNELPAPIEIWLGGKGARQVELKHPRLRFAVSWAELEHALHELRAHA